MGHAGFQRWGYRILRSDAVVSFDRRVEKGKDIIWTAMPGEIIDGLTTISVRQSTKKLLAYALHSTTFELDGDVVLRSRSLQRVERQVAPDALG
jgi:hypothetical protein